jgi:hypothetical protein
MDSRQKTARMAGLLYLLFIVAGALAGVLRSGLINYGDASATAGQIMAAQSLFRIEFAVDLLSSVLFLLAAWALYALLAPSNRNLALLFVFLNLAGVAVASLNMLNQLAALLLLSGAGYLQAFPADQRQALAMLFVTLYRSGFVIAQLFFGTWLLPLGYLVYRSGFLPRVLGVLLIIDFVGEMVWFLQFFFFPGYDVITYPGFAAGFVAEVSLSLWLLIVGVKAQKPAPNRVAPAALAAN